MRSLLITMGFACLVATTASADDRVELNSGDVLIGRVIVQTDERIVLEHPMLGEIDIASNDVASLELAEWEDDPPAPAPPPAPEPEEPEWERELDVGISGAEGNTQFFNLRAAFRATRETERHRWRFDTAFFYGEEDGQRNQTRATVGLLKDWLMPDSPWLYFAQGRFDFDDFRSWTYRLSGHGGVGYAFFDDDEFQLIGRAGAGASRRWKQTESVDPEGLLGLELRWNIDDRQRLTASTTLYPNLGDLFEFRTVSSVAWTMSLDRARGLNISAGIEHEHESDVDPGIKRDELRFFAGLTFLF